MEFCGFFTENAWKIIPFLSFSFLNLLPDDPFSRSFSVVFAVIFGENQKISEKNREFSGIFTEIIPFHSFSFLNTTILCSTTCF